MHYNSPRFYREIRDTNLQKYQVVVSTSFGISAVLYSGIAVFGFLTFGAHSDGFILNNYSPQDPLATFCRMAVGVSTLAAYPIVFIGVRDGVLDLMNVSMEQQTTRQLNIITIVLLTVVTVISIFIHDLGLINSIGGGLVATMIVFVFPTIMFYAVTRSEQQKLQEQQQYANCTETTKMIELSGPSDTDDCATTTSTMRRHENQLIVTIGLAVIGVILGIIGAYIAVQMAEMKQ